MNRKDMVHMLAILCGVSLLKGLIVFLEDSLLTLFLFDPFLYGMIYLNFRKHDISTLIWSVSTVSLIQFILFSGSTLWFIPLASGIVSYITVAYIRRKAWSLQTRWLLSFFFCTKFTWMALSFIFTFLAWFRPESPLLEEFAVGLNSLFKLDSMSLLSDLMILHREVYLSVAILLTGVFYAYLPSLVQLSLSWVHFKSADTFARTRKKERV